MDLIQSGVHLPKLFSQDYVCRFKTTRCCRERKSSCIKLKSLPFTPYVCNFNINPSYQTLSKALEMSKKVPRTSGGRLHSQTI